MKRSLLCHNPLLTSRRTGLGTQPHSPVVLFPQHLCGLTGGLCFPKVTEVTVMVLPTTCCCLLWCILSSICIALLGLATDLFPLMSPKYISAVGSSIFWRIHQNINHLLYYESVTTLPSCGSSMIGINHYISHLLDHCKSPFLSLVPQRFYFLCSLFFYPIPYFLLLFKQLSHTPTWYWKREEEEEEEQKKRKKKKR